MMDTNSIIFIAIFGIIGVFTLTVLAVAFIQEMRVEKVSYNVFFDDIRTVSMVYPGQEHKFEVVRNVEDFKTLIEEKGIPDFISFDHDLGKDENGEIAEDAYEAVKWMVFEKEFDLSNMVFAVHSDNIEAGSHITSLINNWKKELVRRNNEQRN